jgi:cysteine desulfurase / selenocysteine lyase
MKRGSSMNSTRSTASLLLIWVVSVTALLILSLIPQTTSFSPFHHHHHPIQQQQPSSSSRRNYFALFVAQQQQQPAERTMTTKTTEEEATGAAIATDTRFPHAYIATQTRCDFDILNTRRIGGGNNNENDNKTSGHPLIYLDSAATSQQPHPVQLTMNDYYTNRHANVHRGAHTLSREATAAFELSRDKICNFIHANQREEIIFTSGATAAINLVVVSYARTHLHAGDEVILTVAEHHSNLVPWQMLAMEKGIVLHFVQVDKNTGSLDLHHLESLLSSDKTKMVAFQHVSNVLGCINPVQDMVNIIRSKAHPNVKILLDACQSVPHMAINVQTLGIDFLAASGHKMCGPTGIGFLWAKYHVLCEMSPWQGGGEMIDTVTLQGSTWQLPPGRFEAGTPPIAQAIGLGAAIDYLQGIGMDKIEAYEHELGIYLYEQLSAIPGITILGPNPIKNPSTKRAALAAFCHESVHPSDLSTLLDVEGVAIRAGHHCCQPLHNELGYSHSARASLYFYNTPEYVFKSLCLYVCFYCCFLVSSPW